LFIPEMGSTGLVVPAKSTPPTNGK